MLGGAAAAAVALVAAGTLLWDGGASAQTANVYAPPSGLPSVRLRQATTLLAPSSALTFYGSPLSPAAPAAGVRITSLARALRGDPNTIYEYIRNNIEFEPQFGLHKGAEGAVLDESGGAFDQAHLMVSLLRSSGIQARYALGTVSLGPEGAAILKVDTAAQACVLLASGGTPALVNGSSNCASLSGGVASISLLHVWVEAQVNGIWVSYDPSLKSHEEIAGVDIWSGMGATPAGAVNQLKLGLSVTASQVSGLSRTQIAQTMEGLGENLLEQIDRQWSGRSRDELLGGWRIAPSAAAPTATLPGHQVQALWAGDVPEPYRAKLQIVTAGFNQTLDWATVYGDRIQGQFIESGAFSAGPHFQLAIRRCQGVSSATYASCDSANTMVGSTIPANTFNGQLQLTVLHPYAHEQGAYADESITRVIPSGPKIDIVSFTGGSSGKRLSKYQSATQSYLMHLYVPEDVHCQIIVDENNSFDEYCENHGPFQEMDSTYSNGPQGWTGDGSVRHGHDSYPWSGVAGEHPVNDIAARVDERVQSWWAGWSSVVDSIGSLAEARLVHHHSLGVAMAGAADIDSSVAIAASGQFAPHQVVAALASTAGAMESISLGGQFDDNAKLGSSGVELVLNGGASSSGLVRLAAGGGTTALPAGTPQDVRDRIAAYLAAGFEVLANPSQGGFLARRADGGEVAWIAFDPAATAAARVFRKGSTPDPLGALADRSLGERGGLAGEIDLRSGALTRREASDLVVGQGEFPYALSFERTFQSGGGGSREGLGAGWTHNFSSNASMSWDFEPYLDGGPIGETAMYVTAAASLEAAREDSITGVLVAGAVADWFVTRAGQVRDVSVGGASDRFIRALDGEWRTLQPSATSLEVTVNGLEEEVVRILPDQSRQRFTTLKVERSGTLRPVPGQAAVRDWTFSSGVVLTFAYETSPPNSVYNDVERLTKVSNNLGVAIEFVNTPPPTSAVCGDPTREALCARLMSYAGTLNSVQYKNATGTIINSVQFTYTGCEPIGNLCVSKLTSVQQSGRRTRTYAYQGQDFSNGYRGHHFVLLKSVSDAGVSQPRAAYTWEGAGLLLAPRVITAADAGGRSYDVGSTGDFYGFIRDPLGGVSQNWFDSDGRPTKVIDPEGRSSKATYDGFGRPATTTTAWGDVTSRKYDTRSNLIELKRSPRAGCGTDTLYWCQTSVVTATYHPTWNKPATITLPATGPDAQAASTWTFAYNIKGLLETQTSPLVFDGKNNVNASAVSRTWYDAYGRVNRIQDPTGVETRMEYGGYSQPAWCLTRTHAADQSAVLRQTSAFTCNTMGDVLTATDPRGNTTTFTYDALRQKKSEVGPASTAIHTQWDYDPDGNVTQERRWDSTASLWRATTTTYSLTGKPLTMTGPGDTSNPAGHMSRVCYDALDRPVISVDPTGRATRTTYNLAGQPTLVERWFTASVTDATCALTNTRPAHLTTNRWRAMEYNSGGLQSAEIDGNGNRTTMTYDGLGRQMLTTYADGKFVQTLRNERDQVYITFKRGGDVHQAYYDALGRVQRVWEHAAASAGQPYPIGRHTRTSFDLAGRPVFTDVSTQTATTYDATLERDVRTYGYDAAGRVEFDRIKPKGTMANTELVLTYGYDATNNRTSIQWPDGYTATYRYDAANRADRVTFGTHQADIALDSLSRRGGISRSNGVNTTYAYEGDSDLGQINHAWAPAAGQTAATFGFQHDGAGRITGLSINRPDLEWAPSLAYAQSYGVPTNLNQTTSRNGTGLVWDHNGNLDSYGTTDYQWTWGNRLARVVKPGSTTEYAYDSMDRRTVVIEDGVMTRTLWSGADEVGEYDVAGVLKRRFIPDGSGSMDGRLATVNPDNTIHWHHTDHQGSVIATSNAAGQGTGFTNYSPHGEFGTGAGGVALTAPPTGSPFGYTGRQWDAKAGLYQYRARYYDPVLGIFLSMDPIGTKDDPNLYGYVGQDPMNNSDATGTETRSIGKNWVVTPDNPRFSGFSIPRPWLAPREMNQNTRGYHSYTYEHTIYGAGRISEGAWRRILAANPVPNPIRRAATDRGTRNDATLPVPFNSVTSYTRPAADGSFTVVNVTRTRLENLGYGVHLFSNGFVAAQDEIAGDDRVLLTYGEGNSQLQDEDYWFGDTVGSWANEASWDTRAANVQAAVNQELRRMRDNDQRH